MIAAQSAADVAPPSRPAAPRSKPGTKGQLTFDFFTQFPDKLKNNNRDLTDEISDFYGLKDEARIGKNVVNKYQIEMRGS